MSQKNDGSYDVSEETLKNCYKPYSVVTDKYGNVGIITYTDINTCQPYPHQVSYSVVWLVGKGDRNAWYRHSELCYHTNLFLAIAEISKPAFMNKNFISKILGMNKNG